MSVYVEVSGKTYNVKEKLKSFGLTWDGNRKIWKGKVSKEALSKLSKLADKFPIEISTYEDDEDLLEEKAKRHRYRHTNHTNSTWVRCWECGRLIPPGQATKDDGKWYCGC